MSFVDGNGSNGLNFDITKATASPDVVEYASKAYLTWTESNGPAYQIRVKVFNGNTTSPSWSFVDGGGASGLNRFSGQIALTPKLAVHASKLYLTWAEFDSVGSRPQIRVSVYNGNDTAPSWSFVDGNGTYGINRNTNQSGTDPSLVSFGGKLYATWTESYSASQTRVAVYNGNDSTPAWTFVDGGTNYGLNTDNRAVAQGSQLVTFGSKLYCIWSEQNYYSPSLMGIKAAVFNGNDGAPVWSMVDGTYMNFNPFQSAYMPRPIVFNSKMYSTWYEQDSTSGPYQVGVKVYGGNDSSPSWTHAGEPLNKDPARSTTQPVLSAFNGYLHSVWVEFNPSNIQQIRISRYNGSGSSSTSWAFVDGNGTNGLNHNQSSQAYAPAAMAFGSKFLVVWTEENSSSVSQIRAVVGQ